MENALVIQDGKVVEEIVTHAKQDILDPTVQVATSLKIIK